MKLLRFGSSGAEKPGPLDVLGTIRDRSGLLDDLSGDALRDEGLARLKAVDPAELPAVDPSTRVGSCVGQVGKFICIGLNYADHAAESGRALPEEPVVFFKATSAITRLNDTVEIPRGSIKTDWEVELRIIIRKAVKYVSAQDALDHVAGYCVVNSHRYQDGSTVTMYFDVTTVISHLSQFMSLQPSDMISTGTPPGAGVGQSPETYLKPGDTMTLGIEGPGAQRQAVVVSQ